MMNIDSIINRFEIISDEPVLHRAEVQGERIVRVQKVRDNVTGAINIVNFWSDWQTGKITRVS